MNTTIRTRRKAALHVDRLVIRMNGNPKGCGEFVPTCPQCRTSLQVRRNFGKRFAIARETYDWVNS